MPVGVRARASERAQLIELREQRRDASEGSRISFTSEISRAPVSKQLNARMKCFIFSVLRVVTVYDGVCEESLQVVIYIFQPLTAGAVGLRVFPLPVRVNVRLKTYFSFSHTFHFGSRSMTDAMSET